MPGLLVELSYGKNTETVNAGFDSGLSGDNARIGYELADRLGLQRIKQTGQANGKPVYSSYVDQITLMTASGECTLKDLPVVIDPTAAEFGDLYEIVLGAPLLKKINGTVVYGKNGFSLVCGQTTSSKSMVPAVLGMSIGLIGTWVLAKWYFKK